MTTKKPAPRWTLPFLSACALLLLSLATIYFKKDNASANPTNDSLPASAQVANLIPLPSPALKSNTSVESALKSRRTKRAFLDESLDLKTVSQMLWSAQGVTAEWGGRTAPSAKSTYPLTVYLIANKVKGLNAGQYVYIPGERAPIHGLKPLREGDFGEAIFTSLNQNSFKNAPAILVITGNMAKMATAFGGISQDKDVYLEAGHAAQNLYLQAESLKIGMVTNTSSNDGIIRNIISVPEDETIIYLIPFGLPKD